MTTSLLEVVAAMDSPQDLAARKDALERAAAEDGVWRPVFADVIANGTKVGHVVSDGYHTLTQGVRWRFYPIDAHRKTTPSLGAIWPRLFPKRVKRQTVTIGPYLTMKEQNERDNRENSRA